MITFHPNCTLPAQTPAFVAKPNVRSTLDIVWSCLSILILSCWSVLHLNVPAQHKPRSWSQKWRLAWSRLLRKIVWLLIVLAAPECLLLKAVGAWSSAGMFTPELQGLAVEDDVPWTKTHTHLADMGGFRLRFEDAPQHQDKGQHAAQSSENPALEKMRKKMRSYRDAQSHRYGEVDWHLNAVHCRQESLGLAGPEKVKWQGLPESACAMLVALEGNVWTLSGAQLLEARKRRLITKLPRVSKDEIDDRSNSDALIKSLALLQVIWLVSQMITRAVRHLPSTQLEVMTVAFAGCAFAVYLLLWDRPRNVMTPVYLTASRFADAGDMLSITQLHEADYMNLPRPSTCIRNSSMGSWVLKRGAYSDLIFGLSAILFGSIHLIAWNFSFPSSVEVWLWRTSAIITMFSPAALVLCNGVLEKVETRHIPRMVIGVMLGLFLLIIICATLARVFLIVETFRSLYYLPPGAYTTTWATYVPHVG